MIAVGRSIVMLSGQDLGWALGLSIFRSWALSTSTAGWLLIPYILAIFRKSAF